MTATISKELAALETALLEAHGRGDHDALVTLYQRAGELKEAVGDIDAACFYYTHAFVFALETGNSAAVSLRAMLAAHGREVAEISS